MVVACATSIGELSTKDLAGMKLIDSFRERLKYDLVLIDSRTLASAGLNGQIGLGNGSPRLYLGMLVRPLKGFPDSPCPHRAGVGQPRHCCGLYEGSPIGSVKRKIAPRGWFAAADSRPP
jgi:hypothetical protein